MVHVIRGLDQRWAATDRGPRKANAVRGAAVVNLLFKNRRSGQTPPLVSSLQGEGPDRAADVFDVLGALAFERSLHLSFDLVEDLAGNQNAAGLAQRLQPSSNVDALPVNVPVVLDHDIAEIYPDAHFEWPG